MNSLWLSPVADDIVRQEFDYIITVSTPALQVMANANTRIPHIFGAVTDPYRMGIAESSEKHRDNITGVATFPTGRIHYQSNESITA